MMVKHPPLARSCFARMEAYVHSGAYIRQARTIHINLLQTFVNIRLLNFTQLKVSSDIF